MPLLICTLFFSVLFLIEGAWFLAGQAEREHELDRFRAIEHPRRLTSDLYLDMLG